MKTCFLTYLMCFVLCLPSLTFAAKSELEGPIQAEVIRVLDGDTFDVRAKVWVGQYIETRVRLDGLDTPELRGKCSDEKFKANAAKDHLSKLISNKKIILTNIRNGKYAGRVLAKANTADGTDISKDLMDNGFARPYHGEKRQGWCNKT